MLAKLSRPQNFSVKHGSTCDRRTLQARGARLAACARHPNTPSAGGRINNCTTGVLLAHSGFQDGELPLLSRVSIPKLIAMSSKAPKRRLPAAEAPTPRPRQSKLAKEHNVTPAEENEIREAFSLFAEKQKGSKEGVIPIGDVRRAMMLVAPPFRAHKIK